MEKTSVESFLERVEEDLSTKMEKAANFTKNKRALDQTTHLNAITLN